MRVTIERNHLLKALNHVQSVVERRNTIPILSNVLVRADNAAVTLTATDLDIEVVETVTASIARPGATTVPAHMMYDIVRKLPDGAQLDLERGADSGRLQILAGRSKFSLQALPHEDFPDLVAGEPSHRFVIPAGELGRLVEQTRFAISTEETRYYLNGIYLHEVADGDTQVLRAVATDGHRLARAQMSCPQGAGGMPGIIIPRKTVLELVKLIEDVDDDVRVELSASKIRFETNGLVLTSKLIDGTFPDYERVIPQDNDKLLEIDDTRAFTQAVDRVSTVSSDKGRAVKLAISEDRVMLSVNSPEAGSAEEELAATYKSEPIDIGFNARYLLDIAGQFKSANCTLLMADAGSPTILRESEGDGALYVLMPLRV